MHSHGPSRVALQTHCRPEAACRESDGWWRFRVNDLPFQGGLHGEEFRVSVSLGALNTDPAVIDAIWVDIKATTPFSQRRIATCR